MTEHRKEKLENNFYYHIFSRSIAKFTIFNKPEDYSRVIEILDLYRYTNFAHKYSKYLQLDANTQSNILMELKKGNDLLAEIVAYCVMPTHIHLVLKQIKNNGISKYMAKVLNSYSKYFNIKHKRCGPLWAGRFKSVLVEGDDQLLHLTRYIHLNPSSADLVKNPLEWPYSSFEEYVDADFSDSRLCSFDDLIDTTGKDYKKFVLDRKDYQRQISLVKNVLIDDYTG